MANEILRGDIYYADLNPVIGSEQGGIRPVLIIQNDVGNRHSPTVVVAIITGKSDNKAKLPTHYLLKQISCLEKVSMVLLEQIRTIDKSRLKTYSGTLNRKTMKDIDQNLSISLGLTEK